MRLVARAAVILAACLLPACRGDLAPAPVPTTVRRPVAPEEAAADGVLRIGAVLATTGALAAEETPVLAALHAAVDRANARGGVHGRPIEVVEEDTRSTVVDAARVAASLADAGADVLVVGCDVDLAATASRVARRTGRLAISPCATDDELGLDTASSAGFVLAPRASVVAAAVAHRLVDDGARSIITVSRLVPFESARACQGVADAFRSLGGTVVAEVELAADGTDALAAQLARAPAAAAFVSCVDRAAVSSAVTAIRAARPAAAIVAAAGADELPWPGPPVEGVTFPTTALLWPPAPAVAELAAAGAHGGASLRTMVAVDLLVQVATAAGPTATTSAYAAALRTTTFTTAIGPVRFDERQRAVDLPVVFARTDASGGAAAPRGPR